MTFKQKRAKHIALGQRGESLAVRLLVSRGYELAARNWRCTAGELDLVARDGRTLVFVEVKTRRRLDRYRPGENLSPRQRERNIAAAKQFIRRGGLAGYRIRFDLIEVVCSRWVLHEIRHYRNFVSAPGGVL